jgi:hypothetical protein
MSTTKKELLVTTLHTLEVVICFVLAFVILKWAGMESNAKELIGGTALVFIAKLMREIPAIPVNDWVNTPFLSKPKPKV